MEERRLASGARTRRLVYPYGASSVAVSCSQSLGSHMNSSVYTGSPGLFGHPLTTRCFCLVEYPLVQLFHGLPSPARRGKATGEHVSGARSTAKCVGRQTWRAADSMPWTLSYQRATCAATVLWLLTLLSHRTCCPSDRPVVSDEGEAGGRGRWQARHRRFLEGRTLFSKERCAPS